jgi:coproporphyrinogen III oxidase-like Fe-S oxidoreductase
VGVGPAAFSREGLSRRENIGTFGLWAEAVEAGRLPFCTDFTVSADEDETERFVVRTRLSRWKGPDMETAAGKRRMIILEELLAEGFVKKCENGHWSLTPRGREVADAVMERLI